MSRQDPNRSSSPIENSSTTSHSHHYERKRPRDDDNEDEDQYHSRPYRPYPNPRPTQIQTSNPPPRRIPSFSRSFDHHSHHHPLHEESTLVPTTTRQSPLLSMTSQIEPRLSPSFLLTDLLHRVLDSHAASYTDNSIPQQPTTASIDLIAYAWVSPDQESFSSPAAFTIQFGDFFDLFISDETPVVGLTAAELDRIPTMIYHEPISDEKCAVCLSEYIHGENLKSLKCQHYFHSECIDRWLKVSTRCPICRGEQTN